MINLSWTALRYMRRTRLRRRP